jgi:hypothetical protein
MHPNLPFPTSLLQTPPLIYTPPLPLTSPRTADRNRDGFIDLTELLVAVKGKMNPKRAALVKMAFNLLDTDK